MRVIVSAMKERQPYVDYLRFHIPQLEIVWDKRHYGMDTFLRGQQAAGKDPVLRLEDDICLVKDFLERAQMEIDAHPNDCINFFSRSKYDVELGSRMMSGGTFRYNVCTYYPAGMARDVFKFYDVWAKAETEIHSYDVLVADYLTSEKKQYWQVVPSLVQHAATVSQIDPRRARHRHSPTFIEPELRGYPKPLV